jgi:phosphatidylglycerophosphatase A
MKKINEFLATGFYVGYFPIAPGTFGSFTISLSVWLYHLLFGIVFMEKILFLLFIIFIGIISSASLLKNSKEKDPGYIVIDEWAGQMTAYLFAPVTFENLIAGFIFFRIFDISKIYPVNKAELLRGEYGVMFDDLVAGIYAGICLFLWNYYI